MAQVALKSIFTSDGSKFFAHEEAMRKLRNGQGQPITCHTMITDHCAHQCAFCSVHNRAKNVLPMSTIEGFLKILLRYGLKSVIISGGGNPILYRCPETKAGFNEVVQMMNGMGLEVGLITDGMAMKEYPGGRRSWRTVYPETLDMLTWVRISMAGLDHEEDAVFVPDIDPAKTTLGFSYVYHDIYACPEDDRHGKVSTIEDLIQIAGPLSEEEKRKRMTAGQDRLPKLTEQMRHYVETYKPRYLRLLPNCLEILRIAGRCEELKRVAEAIDPNVVFVQNKPPQPHTACWLGLIHPVLNSDGYCYPCDSVVLNEEAGHKFASPWRMCHWSEIGQLYERPIKSLIADPQKQCPGCVFGSSNVILDGVVKGTIDATPPAEMPEHVNFV